MSTPKTPSQDEQPRRIKVVKEWYRLGWLLPWLVLAASLTITYMMWDSENENAKNSLQLDFDYRVRETHSRIEERIKAYELILHGVSALFMASKKVEQHEFHDFVEALHLDAYYSGSQTIGFAAAVPSQKKNSHIAAIHASGFPGYSIKPGGNRDLYAPVNYIEPSTDDIRNKVGFDLYSDPVRRAAMELARDTGNPVNSGKLLLPASEDDDVRIQSGFVMFLPVYKQGWAIDTVSERQANIIGWVYASFRMTDLMSGILGEIATEIDIEIHDGAEISDKTMLFDPDVSGAGGNPDAQFINTSRLEFEEHLWTTVIVSLPGFEERTDRSKSNFVAYVGIMMSLLLTILAWLLVQGRALALHSSEAINRELVERKAAEERMQYMAHHDVLTGLPNRALFSDRLQRGLVLAKRDKGHLALMFLDLDKFKPVNDTYGHAVGDQLLKEVAQRLQNCVRESDTVSRIGGDEFVVLLPSIEAEQDAMLVAEKMLHALNQTFELAGQSLHISCSIGVAVYPEHGNDELTLTHNADIAMYYTKSGGRNNARLYRPEMQGAGQ
ncbi:MAG: diguanylate cyclase [Gallionella sp.]|nr:diguanylate cyclase [Gallionella sp.]